MSCMPLARSPKMRWIISTSVDTTIANISIVVANASNAVSHCMIVPPRAKYPQLQKSGAM